MFDIGWGELLVVGIVALIMIGPKQLPLVLNKGRRMASEFRDQFRDAMTEAELFEPKFDPWNLFQWTVIALLVLLIFAAAWKN